MWVDGRRVFHEVPAQYGFGDALLLETLTVLYGFSGDERPTKCGDCKAAGMVDIVSRRCGCPSNKQPKFGLPGDSRPTKCGDCKADGMANVVNRLCGCPSNKRPIFGLSGDSRPTKCGDCKAEGMVDIVNKRCECGSFGSKRHPVSKSPLCWACARSCVSAADDGTSKGKELSAMLQRHFGFKRTLTLRIEHAVRHRLLQLCSELTQLPAAHDQDVLSALAGKAKQVRKNAFRPDCYFINPTTNLALHLEIDEYDDHEDNDDRIAAIEKTTGVQGTYVIRIRCHHKMAGAVCREKRLRGETGVVHAVTKHGEAVLGGVVEYIRECLDRMKSGVLPNEVTRKRVF